MNRNWQQALAKVEREGKCRRCHREGVKLDAAHLIGRECDTSPTVVPVPGWGSGLVCPVRIIPLCRLCHRRDDGQSEPRIDVLGCVTLAEQIQAIEDAGGISQALDRLAPTESHRRVRSSPAFEWTE